jgi:hypothetical protein
MLPPTMSQATPALPSGGAVPKVSAVPEDV